MTRFTVEDLNNTVGPCPHCGKVKLWFNDVPLAAFCWGSEDDPHPEWRKVVPMAQFVPNKETTA